MNWTSFARNLRLTAALSLPIFCAGCATDKARLADSFVAKAQADIASETLAAAEASVQAARDLPGWPAGCNTPERTGVREGDPLHVAAQKGDNAVGRANARLAACAAWYETLRAGRGAKEGQGAE